MLCLGALLQACSAHSAAPPAGDGIDPSLPTMEPDFVEVPGTDGGSADAEPEGSSDAAVSDEAGPDAGGDAGPDAGNVAALERLLVADALESKLYVYDVSERKLLNTFGVDERARVYAGATGRFGYALFGGRALVVDMGLIQQGGSHFSLLQSGPSYPLSGTLSGSAPGALLAHAGKVAVFFEGDAKAMLLDESSLPQDFAVQTIALGAPHRGFAFALGSSVLATREQAGEVALRRFAADGAEDAASFDCTQPDAAAVASGIAAVGCANGFLRLSESGSARLLPFPAAAGSAPVRAIKLVGHPSKAQILAWLGDQLCALGTTLICQPVAADCVDIGFDAAGERALLLASDGSLRAFDAHTLEPLGALTATTAVTGDDQLMLPALGSGLRYVYVSDPQAGRVHVIDPASLQVIAELELPGAPARLAVFTFHAPL